MMKTVSRGDSMLTPPRREDPPDNYLDDMAECLLFYFNRFQWLEVKNEIEETCDIKNQHLWSNEDIKKASDETERMVKKRDPKVKQWACVVTFQIKQRLDYEKHKTSETQSSLTDAAQPFGTVTPDLSHRPADRASQRGYSAIGIKIPLSELFGNEATSEQAVTIPSEYKLTDGCPSRRKITRKKSYVSSYNENTNNPDWVFEILNKQTLAQNYTGTGRFPECDIGKDYNKGHLAAARNNRWSKQAFEDTFDLINMSPQLAELNNCMWKSLEHRCRKKAKDNNIRNLHVYTGTIILDSGSVGQSGNKKAVPDYFYKVIIEETDGTVSKPVCYLIYNDKDKIKHDLETRGPERDFLTQRYRIHIENTENENIGNIEHTEKTEDIKNIKNIIGKIFVRPAQMYTDEIRSVTWTGEGDGETLHSVHIEVRMSIPE
nr:uncharacterized protein LOC101885345 [Danio rerio]|eukprot:XP_021328243.1 uncharacterized protein LOC101885345 [Danio rerio]